MDEDRRKGTLCGLLAAGLRMEGLLRVAIERPETCDEIEPQIREAFELYSTIFEKAWPSPSAPSAPSDPSDQSDPSDSSEEIPAIEAPATEEPLVEAPVEVVVVESVPQPAPAVKPLADTLKVDELLARKESADLRRAFTLNDKFRFRRTLFEGSDARFVEVLDALEAMKSIAEAETYLSGIIDVESEDGADFMNIVNAHFGGKS